MGGETPNGLRLDTNHNTYDAGVTVMVAPVVCL